MTDPDPRRVALSRPFEAWSRPRSGRAAQAAGGVLVALLVANCSGPQATGKRNKYGVAASPRVVEEGQPVPKGGGREMTGKPYVVGGRTYTPHAGPGYDREGWASWYGSAFHGRLTANGEVFDRGSIAAAHPTLPLPSYVRVTNATNRRSMIVRVNDRGPYEHDRVIDVSEQVADALGFKRNGVSRVRVQYVGRASIHGSDDAKLLATLRNDGSEAPAGGLRGRTMLAAAEPRPGVRPGSAPELRSASRAAPLDDADDVAPPPRRVVAAADARPSGEGAARAPESRPFTPPPRRATEPAEEAEPPAARPLSLRPPERPAFAEIYYADPRPGRRPATDPFAKLKSVGVKPLRAGPDG